MKTLTLAFVALCYVVTLVRGEITFIDSNGIEEIAEAVCKNSKNTKMQLGHLSTLNKLTDFLGAVGSDHNLYNCRTDYLESIHELVKVVETASGDICSDEKLSLIEQYHRRHVSKVNKHVKEQKQGNKVPKMIRLLFMRYASEVSSICEESALTTMANNRRTYGPDEMAKVEQMRKFTDSLGMTNLQKGYKGIYLFWNMVNSLNLSEKDKFAPYIADEGQSTRINLKMRNGKAIKALQATCLHQLKPVYGKSLLPVLRLVDMGYYPSTAKLIDLLNTPSDVRSLFFAAQICETIMPIEVFEDQSLQDDQFIALTSEEASKLSPIQLKSVEELAKNRISVEVTPSSMDIDDLTESDIKAIKLNVEDRSNVVNLMLKQLLRQTKKKLKSLFKGIKLFRRDQNNELQLDQGEEFEKIEEDEVKVEVEDEHGEDGQVRTKRGLGMGLIAVIFGIAYPVYWIVLTLLKLVFLPIPSLILLFCGSKDVMEELWSFGYMSWDKQS